MPKHFWVANPSELLRRPRPSRRGAAGPGYARGLSVRLTCAGGGGWGRARARSGSDRSASAAAAPAAWRPPREAAHRPGPAAPAPATTANPRSGHTPAHLCPELPLAARAGGPCRGWGARTAQSGGSRGLRERRRAALRAHPQAKIHNSLGRMLHCTFCVVLNNPKRQDQRKRWFNYVEAAANDHSLHCKIPSKIIQRLLLAMPRAVSASDGYRTNYVGKDLSDRVQPMTKHHCITVQSSLKHLQGQTPSPPWAAHSKV